MFMELLRETIPDGEHVREKRSRKDIKPADEESSERPPMKAEDIRKLKSLPTGRHQVFVVSMALTSAGWRPAKESAIGLPQSLNMNERFLSPE